MRGREHRDVVDVDHGAGIECNGAARAVILEHGDALWIAGIVALVPVISPYRAGRDAARAAHEATGVPFIEVFVDTSLEVCEERDPKGLYAKARAGELTGMTGIDDPYEPPERPEVHLHGEPLEASTAAVVAALALRSPA